MRCRLPVAIVYALAFVSPVAAAEKIVAIENFTFKPAAITVHAGDQVIFKNVDDIPHSVVLSDGSFHTKALDTDDTASIAFDKIGDHPYFCGLHPHMQGRVTVVP